MTQAGSLMVVDPEEIAVTQFQQRRGQRPSRLRAPSLCQLLRIARLPTLSAKRAAFASLGLGMLS